MSRLLAATLGLVTPRFRTVAQWIDVYQEILSAKAITPKTLENRKNILRYISAELGSRTISKVRPHEIAKLTRDVFKEHPHTARRVLMEARSTFHEAIAYGWVDSNPAMEVKPQLVKIARRRLTLEDWRRIHTYAEENMPPWVSRMLVLALVSGQRRGDLQKMQFSDVIDGHLQIKQQKTGTMIRLPLGLRLAVLDTTLEQAIESCRSYAKGDQYLLRKSTGDPLAYASMSARFEDAREGAVGLHTGEGAPASLHECRSLAERLYRAQGLDTKTLLGHARQHMTDVYNNDRGLTKGEWKTLTL